jgi:hypothetical protein
VKLVEDAVDLVSSVLWVGRAGKLASVREYSMSMSGRFQAGRLDFWTGAMEPDTEEVPKRLRSVCAYDDMGAFLLVRVWRWRPRRQGFGKSLKMPEVWTLAKKLVSFSSIHWTRLFLYWCLNGDSSVLRLHSSLIYLGLWNSFFT